MSLLSIWETFWDFIASLWKVRLPIEFFMNVNEAGYYIFTSVSSDIDS